MAKRSEAQFDLTAGVSGYYQNNRQVLLDYSLWSIAQDGSIATGLITANKQLENSLEVKSIVGVQQDFTTNSQAQKLAYIEFKLPLYSIRLWPRNISLKNAATYHLIGKNNILST